jgi:hypothetical protein
VQELAQAKSISDPMTTESLHDVKISQNQPGVGSEDHKHGWKDALVQSWTHLWLGFTKPIPVRLKESDLLLLKTIYACDATARLSWQAFRERGYCIEMLQGDECSILTALRSRLQALLPDDPSMEKLKGHYRYTWTRNQIERKQIAGGLAELAANGIDGLVLQDAGLLADSKHVADTKHLRPLSAWILVRPEDYQKALAIVKTMNLQLRICQHLTGGLQESVWINAVAVQFAGYPGRALSGPDLLLNHLLSSKTQTITQTLWFADTVRLLGTCGSQPDVDKFMAGVEERSLALPVLRAWQLFREIANRIELDFDLGSYKIVPALDTMPVSTKEILLKTKSRLLPATQP